tara:strand:- start:252 stop:353 length:102 start_codon:yes stop_codon:yes gene_type:complete
MIATKKFMTVIKFAENFKRIKRGVTKNETTAIK